MELDEWGYPAGLLELRLPRVFNPEKHVLGDLCNKGHDYQGSGKSICYKNGRCVECNSEKGKLRNQLKPLVKKEVWIKWTRLHYPGIDEIHFLGAPCEKGHTWNGTPCCLRYSNHGSCVECHNERRSTPEHQAALAKWRAENKAHISEYNKRYGAEHLDARRERDRRNRAADPEKFKERDRQYREKHRERRLLYSRQYHAEHREERALKRREWYEANREEILARLRHDRQENLEEYRARERERYWNNRDSYLAKAKRNYKSRKKPLEELKVRPWKDWEIDLLTENYEELGAIALAEYLPGRTPYAIRVKANRLDLFTRQYWSPEEDVFLVENYHSLGIVEVARRMEGRSYYGVLGRAAKLGLTDPFSPWSNEEIEILKDFYWDLSIQELLAKLPGRTLSSIHSFASKYRIKRKQNTYDVDVDFFQTPNLLNSYWAGFIAADGCVVKNGGRLSLQISLQGRDAGHLRKLSRDCGYTGTVTLYKLFTCGQVRRYARLSITCTQQWFPDLEKNFKITQRKSLTLEAPSGLDLDCTLAYIAGYVDGDGWAYVDKRKGSSGLCLGVIGTKSTLEWIKTIFDQIAPPRNNQKKVAEVCAVVRPSYATVYTYVVSGQRAEKIATQLLELDIPRLHRKWDGTVKPFLKVKSQGHFQMSLCLE